MIPLLSLLPDQERGRVKRDRLELLTALLNAPGFDPLFRTDLVELPPRHPIFWWQCEVDDCDRVARGTGLCTGHTAKWRDAKQRQVKRAEFARTVTPLQKIVGLDPGLCRICQHRPAKVRSAGLCERHWFSWRRNQRNSPKPTFDEWLAKQTEFRSFGGCRVTVCPHIAVSPLGLCVVHRDRYRHAGRPGMARIPGWYRTLELNDLPVPVLTDDETAFRRWCAIEEPVYRDGVVNLIGLQPLVKAEIQWGMYAHTQRRNPTRWEYSALQHLAVLCRANRVVSLFDLTENTPGRPKLDGHSDSRVRMIMNEILEGLWCIYYSPQDTRDAGFIETDQLRAAVHRNAQLLRPHEHFPALAA